MHGATLGNEACPGRARQSEAAASQASHARTLQWAQGAPTPSFKDPPQGQSVFPNLLAFCLEEGVPGSLSIPYQSILAVLMLSRVYNHAYGSRGTWALLGQHLSLFMSLSSGPTLSLAMQKTPARLYLGAGG